MQGWCNSFKLTHTEKALEDPSGGGGSYLILGPKRGGLIEKGWGREINRAFTVILEAWFRSSVLYTQDTCAFVWSQ